MNYFPLIHLLTDTFDYRWNVGAATMITVGGRLADVFGRRYFFLAAPVIMAVGSIVGANGKSVPMMIVASAINGFGAGFGEMALGAVQEFVSYRLRVQILGGSRQSYDLREAVADNVCRHH